MSVYDRMNSLRQRLLSIHLDSKRSHKILTLSTVIVSDEEGTLNVTLLSNLRSQW